MQWSSRRPWRRYAAEIGTAMLISLPLLASSATAGAAAQPQVDFGGGGLGLLLCGSKPNVGSISVPAQSKVIFVNNLGQNAVLQIDGEDGGDLASGEAVEIQFHRGPVAVAMVPECLLNLTGDFEPVTVQVTQTRTQPRTSPRTTTSPRPTAGTLSSGTSTPSPKPVRSSPAAAVTPGAAEPTDSEPIDDELFPLDPDENETPAGPDSTAATVIKDSDSSALIPTSRRDTGPVGLLAIIATVCVVGVSAGAIRAIISQRASQAEFA